MTHQKFRDPCSGTLLFRNTDTSIDHFNRHLIQVQNAFPLTAIYYNKTQTAHYSINQTAFLVPAWSVQNLVDNEDARLSLMQGFHHRCSTGHYNTTGTHSTCLWLALLIGI